MHVARSADADRTFDLSITAERECVDHLLLSESHVDHLPLSGSGVDRNYRVAFRDDRDKGTHPVAVIDQPADATPKKIFRQPVTVLLIEASLLEAGKEGRWSRAFPRAAVHLEHKHLVTLLPAVLGRGRRVQ
jgi:hypothetical protein